MIEKDRVLGYRFVANMGPRWPEVASFVLSRARSLGLYSGKDDYFAPRASACSVSGTHWSRLASPTRCDVYEYRRDIDSMVVAQVNVPLEGLLYCYGLSGVPDLVRPGLDRFVLDKAVGLWLRGGSLGLYPWEHGGVDLPEQTIAAFNLPSALSALAGEATGRGELTEGRGVIGAKTEVDAKVWAPGCRIFARSYPERFEVQGDFLSPQWRISIKVDLLVAGPDSEGHGP
jgi:hypothetical protein